MGRSYSMVLFTYNLDMLSGAFLAEMTTEAKDAFRRGIACFKAQEYEQALEHFSNVCYT